MTSKKKTILWVLALAVFTTACGMADTAINEVGLIYEGGLTQDKTYKGLLLPGATNNSIGMGSEVYRYPNDQRSWVSGQDAPAVTVVSNDEVNLSVPYQLYFTLNTDEETLREFHEKIGVKVKAYKSEGWTQMLNTYFAPQVDRAMDEAALKFDWRELRSNEETRIKFQREVVVSLKRKINEVVGGNYFCGPNYNGPGTDCGDFTFTVGKPEPVNPDLVKSIEQEQINDTQVAAQVAANRRIDKELEALEKQVALFGPEVYAWLQAIEASKAAGVAPPPFFPAGLDITPFVDAR